MNVTTLPYSGDMEFGEKDLAYINGDKKLTGFAKYKQDASEFSRVINDKSKSYDGNYRGLIAKALDKQYSELPEDTVAARQIERLKNPDTFTVVTAHQPCLFTGPLYVIYKILSAINLSEQLNKQHPNNHIVPVFVTGGEDHDLEEINHAHIYGKKVEWNPGQTGAVGRMDLVNTDELVKAIENFAGKSPFGEEAVKLVRESFEGSRNYGHAFRKLVAALFSESGLIILSMDDPSLKAAFSSIIEDDLLNNTSRKLVAETQDKIRAAGFQEQAYPREVNCFYHSAEGRLRIEKTDGRIFQLVGGEKRFSEEEMLSELRENPGKFSPNVVLRPLYQELLLPNLAYVGGGGEISYWLERGSQFEHYGINFPMLVRRNSVFWFDHIACKNLNQLGLGLSSVFSDPEKLIKDYLIEHAGEEITLADEKKLLGDIFRAVEEKAVQLERSILKTIRAEEAKHLKSIDHLEHKLLKAKKQQMDVKVNKIRKTHDKLFPEGKPQERFDNFIMYYFRLGPDFISGLKDHLNPLKKEVVIIQEAD